MKNHFKEKNFFKKTRSLLNLAVFLAFFLNSKQLHAWTGFDYVNKTTIDIGQGNLVREGLVIQFYDSKDDNFHTAKILFINEVASGTEIQLKDLDTKKERTFLMQQN
jgi:hypothetical protein